MVNQHIILVKNPKKSLNFPIGNYLTNLRPNKTALRWDSARSARCEHDNNAENAGNKNREVPDLSYLGQMWLNLDTKFDIPEPEV